MPTQQRAIETRTTILEAAARVFARQGYEATSFSALISETGLTKGAFYFHFSSKEELALETMRYKQHQLIQQISAAVPPAARGIERLSALLRARATALEDDESLACVLRLGAELGSVSNPSSDYSQLNEWPITLFADMVAEGQQDAAIRVDVDPRTAGELIFAAVIGMDTLARQLTGGTDLRARTEQLLELLRLGLEPRPAEPRGPTTRKETSS